MTENIKEKALKMIEDAHNEDPNTKNGVAEEQLYADRMSKWLHKVDGNASDLYKLAARCQHLYRWKIKRTNYSMDKKGYYQWRYKLYQFQADEAYKILIKAEYSEHDANLVKNMINKKNLRNNAAAQVLEDIACLCFLEHYLADFIDKNKDYSEEKWIEIIQKTWNKMSEKAHELALKINYRDSDLTLIKKALM